MLACAIVYFGGLFDESLGRAWAEDDLTAAVWRKHFGPEPFMIAPTAWMHHEGSVTSNRISQEERAESLRRYQQKLKDMGLT
jgi:hypothetical protein